MNAILEKARQKVDQAEVFHLRRRLLPVEFDAEGLSVIKAKHIEGAALRAVCKGRLGYSTSTDLAHPAAIVEAAVATAAYGDETDLEFPGHAIDPIEGIHHPETAALSAEQLVALGEAIRERILADASDVEVGVSVQTTVDHVHIANTNGLDAEETRSSVSVSLEVTRAKQGDIFTVGDVYKARVIGDLAVEDITRRVLRLLRLGMDIASAPSGSLPVVFTPTGTLALLLPLIIGLSGKSVLLGLSPLDGKLGEAIFDSRFSLIDDNRLVSGAAAGSFDDEGVPTQRTTLIEGGQLRGFYYDLRTAKQAGVDSTGNGYKSGLIGGSSFRPAPSASLSNLVVDTGDATEDDLVRGMKKGLLVDGVLGLGQGNLNAGDFSNNVAAAFLIEDGRIAGRVKNVMLAGNSYDLLRHHLIGLGDRADWVYGRISCPAIAIDKVNVAAK
ncbi:TldD/PmbA family protein [Candidatus Bipolaricaulota bacterium]|nr:TldD/PmbA family protein [Candidatus Bipolaricaulota bacterium]